MDDKTFFKLTSGTNFLPSVAAASPTSELTEQQVATKFGKCIAEDIFGTKRIKIYSKGYVSINGVFGLVKNSPEKLIAINSNSDSMGKKSGLGRAVGAYFTMGANLAFSPNRRGDLYLTVITEASSYSLHVTPPTDQAMRAMTKLESAGNGVISAATATVSSDDSESPQKRTKKTGVSAKNHVKQLKELAELHKAGALTDKEFTAAKAKVIGTK